MGWGAAEAFYEENRSWLDSPADAYELLYGPESEPADKPRKTSGKRWKWGCRLCGKRMHKRHALKQHLKDFHRWEPDAVEAEAAFRESRKSHAADIAAQQEEEA